MGSLGLPICLNRSPQGFIFRFILPRLGGLVFDELDKRQHLGQSIDRKAIQVLDNRSYGVLWSS